MHFVSTPAWVQHCPRSCLAPPSFPQYQSLPVNGRLRVTLVMSSSSTETLLGLLALLGPSHMSFCSFP